MSSDQPNKHVAVVGAGISGLAAAKNLIDQGYDVTIIDPASRTGGKINTVSLGDDGHKADVAAEFIDKKQLPMFQKLAEEYNKTLPPEYHINIIPSGNLNETFHLPNGKTLSSQEFYAAYKPIAEQIIADKLELANNPKGERAQHLLKDNMSMADYLKELNAHVKDDRPWWKKLFTRKPHVDDNIIKMAEQVFAGEHGRPASKLSGLQFIHEAGNDVDSIIASDAAYRIEGGTKRLIDAMEADIRMHNKGRDPFMLGTEVDKIQKKDGGFSLGFKNGEEQQYDQVVFATAAHQLAGIKGLKDVGLSKDDVDTLRDLQYTRNSKITIRIQDTDENKKLLANECFFYSDGYQTWQRPGEGSLVFLIGDELPDKYKNPKDLMKHVLEDYAKGHNTSVEKLFGTNNVDKLVESGQINFQGPGGNKPCYASPAPGQSIKLAHVKQSFEEAAKNGVGFAATYIPGQDGTVGYMGEGLESAEHTVGIMARIKHAITQALGIPEMNREYESSLPPKQPPGRGWQL